MRVLFVEDDPSFRRLSAVLARRAGHVTEAVDSVAAALALLQQESFDLVALDLELPDGTGLQVCERILAESGKDLSMVVITGHKDPDLARGCESLGLGLIEKGSEFPEAFQRLMDGVEQSRAEADR